MGYDTESHGPTTRSAHLDVIGTQPGRLSDVESRLRSFGRLRELTQDSKGQSGSLDRLEGDGADGAGAHLGGPTAHKRFELLVKVFRSLLGSSSAV
jgi:hypothetical protein